MKDKIIGATNKFYAASGNEKPFCTQKMIAEKGCLRRTWTLSTIMEWPSQTRQDGTAMYRPVKSEVASKLSLRDVFEKMQGHEDEISGAKRKGRLGVYLNVVAGGGEMVSQSQKMLSFYIPERERENRLKQDRPTDNPRYWRNVKLKKGL